MWYISHLLKNKIEIKSKHDFESDEYNDLIVIESKIEHLHKDGIISDEELDLISYLEDGKPMVSSKEDFGKNRISLSKDFNNLCNKIAFYVGGYFTDDGYLYYMKNKYNLSDEELLRMQNYMNSKYKNKLVRKQRKTDV